MKLFQFCLFVMVLLVFLSCWYFGWIKPKKTNLLHSDFVLKQLNHSLIFVEKLQTESNGNYSIFYDEDVIGFYEWSNWKRIKDSSYSTLRNGDFGITRNFYGNRNYINSVYGFNTIMNLMIPVDRLTVDTRHPNCRHWHYHPKMMPTVSIIIALHSEDTIVLIRTLYSILLNTPRHLLSEIILVAETYQTDKSFFDKLFNKIKEFRVRQQDQELGVKFFKYYPQMPLMFGEHVNLSKIRYFVTGKYVGLAKTLNLAIEKATGDVLVFLKSHVEVGNNWLPPLLAPIIDDERTISIPHFTDIMPTNFAFSSTNKQMELIFWNWGLFSQVKSVEYPSHLKPLDYIKTLPYQIDLINSIQFAVSKNFLKQIGLFNPNYLILDETNLDLSVRVLLAGSNILKVPCSQVFTLRKLIPNSLLQIFDDIYIENNFKFEPRCYLNSIAKQIFPSDQLFSFYINRPAMLVENLCNESINGYEISHVSEDVKYNFFLNITNLNGDSGGLFFVDNDRKMPILRTNSFRMKKPSINNYTGTIMNSYYWICLHVEIPFSHSLSSHQVEVAYCHDRPTITNFRLDSDGILRIDRFCIFPKLKPNEKVFSLFAYDCFFDEWKSFDRWVYTEMGQFRYLSDQCLTFGDDRGILIAPCLLKPDPTQIWKWINIT